MAVNVDTVYKTVLLILNKEQRGYIPPYEFNKIATQVQLEIFEKYFEDLNQQLRVPENDSEYANRVKNVDEKIDIFKRICDATYSTDYFYLPNNDITAATLTVGGTGYSTSIVPQATTGGSGSGCTVNTVATAGAVTSFTIANRGSGYQIGDILTISGGGGNATITVTTICDPVHRLGTVMYREKEVQRIQRNEYLLVNKSSLTTPTTINPVYILEGNVSISALHDKIFVYPNSIQSGVTVSYVTKPTDPDWGYTVGSNGEYLHSPGASTNFQLHGSEQTNIILNILIYAGVIIRDPQIVQNAAQMVQQDEVNEKS
jgi:hypothetical protein